MRIFLAGHNGMVGSAIHNVLQEKTDYKVVTRSRDELDLTNQNDVEKFLQSEKLDAVIIAAARVGGINANLTYPAEFIYENIQIQTNLIHSTHSANIQKLLFLGSSCIYPRTENQILKEKDLLSGSFEGTNEPYAIAKVAGIKMCESYNRQYCRDYRSVIPTNLYGPRDNFNLENGHVIPALMRRFHEAKVAKKNEVVVWGRGSVLREFMYVEDMADACLFILKLDKKSYTSKTEPTISHVNVGTGKDITVRKLAEMLQKIVGFEGDIGFDESKPEGASKKLMDSNLLNSLGWAHKFDLESGLIKTYEWYKENQGFLRIC